jgi:hypothetical protein
MSDKRNRGGEPGDNREFRGNDGNQEARDRGETGRFDDDPDTDPGALGASPAGGRQHPANDTDDKVRRRVHQEGEEPLPYDHAVDEELGTEEDSGTA